MKFHHFDFSMNFKFNPLCSTLCLQLLGAVFQEFLMRKEDYLRALRGFLREIVRQVRNEFNFYSFAWSLMQKREQLDLQLLEPQHKV